jgi:hypothetical protein
MENVTHLQKENNFPIPDINRQQCFAFLHLMNPSENQLVEIRVIQKRRENGPHLLGFYSDFDLLIEHASEYQGRAAIYVGLNPRPREAAGDRGLNILEPGRGAGGKDIVDLRFFPIDVDSKRPDKDTCATAEEEEAAQLVANAILKFLNSRGIFAIVGDSGNGAHLLILTFYNQKINDEVQGRRSIESMEVLWHVHCEGGKPSRASLSFGVFIHSGIFA